MFEVILFFKLRTTIQQKTVKPTYLLSVRCQEAGGRKRARGCLDEKRRTGTISRHFKISATHVELYSAAFRLLHAHVKIRCIINTEKDPPAADLTKAIDNSKWTINRHFKLSARHV